MKRLLFCLFACLFIGHVMAQQNLTSNTVQRCTFHETTNTTDCQSELKLTQIILDEAGLVVTISSDDVVEKIQILGKEFDVSHNSWLYNIVGDDGEIKVLEHREVDRIMIIRPVHLYDGSLIRSYTYH